MIELLKQTFERGQAVSMENLEQSNNSPLVKAIQTRLCEFGILDPVIGGDKINPFGPIAYADGILGRNTSNAIAAFHRYLQLPQQVGRLEPMFFKLLADSTPGIFFPLQLNPLPGDSAQDLLAKRILRYMTNKNYWIARAADMFNIVYVEGIDGSGKPNKDQFNEWNDRRCVIRILPDGQPEMLVNDLATTEPGKLSKENQNAKGAARIAFGQYKAWKAGLHKGTQLALRQASNLRVHRDLNNNHIRDRADLIDVNNNFAINQHTTKLNSAPNMVNDFSAGCLVGRRYPYHLSFLYILQQDWRYKTNPNYMFMTTVINGDELTNI